MEKNGGQSEKEAKFYLGVVGLAVSSLPPVGFFARGLTIRQVTFRMGSELDQGSRDASKREKLRREEKKQNPFVQWRGTNPYETGTGLAKMNSLYQICSQMLHGTKVIILVEKQKKRWPGWDSNSQPAYQKLKVLKVS